MYERVRANYEWIISIDPADDYAQFGLGLAATKAGDLKAAVEHLALAAAMRPTCSTTRWRSGEHARRCTAAQR
jgi:Flp pilus assembly protein TadD